MLYRFQSYQLAVALYRECKNLKLRGNIRDQLDRATLSIALNLAEGTGKLSLKEKARFYQIALGSTRESQALLDIIDANPDLRSIADRLGAMIYRLIQATNRLPKI